MHKKGGLNMLFLIRISHIFNIDLIWSCIIVFLQARAGWTYLKITPERELPITLCVKFCCVSNSVDLTPWQVVWWKKNRGGKSLKPWSYSSNPVSTVAVKIYGYKTITFYYHLHQLVKLITFHIGFYTVNQIWNI
jgi:hypothetical protein